MALVFTDRELAGESNDDGNIFVNCNGDLANHSDELSPCPSSSSGTTDVQHHLKGMFAFLQKHHLLKEAVKLESIHAGRTRYLAIVACFGQKVNEEEETCLLGFDCCGEQTTLGLVLPVYARSSITLDGDGGFTFTSFTSAPGQHIFKPVSVHTMWAVLQTLHKAVNRAHVYNHFDGGPSHHWVSYYVQSINSDRSCLNEWHALPDVEYPRPPSPDVLHQSGEKTQTERRIRATLKDVMMSLDLDSVTSKEIRKRVEDELNMDLCDYKSFIDEEILKVMGQMDGASKIFEHVYLGSEWNAANLEELQRNGVHHILNVTREIDNFFPGQFEYCNIRVYDDEATQLLGYWDRTFKFIRKAHESGSKVLVHCKMGISRSASVVIAYAMKANDWSLHKALAHVRKHRSCVKPNASFMEQLEIYGGILDASRQRHNKLWRSKSETNLKHQAKNLSVPGSPNISLSPTAIEKSDTFVPSSILVEETASKERSSSLNVPHPAAPSGLDVPGESGRPKSWSPDDNVVSELFPEQEAFTSTDEIDCPDHSYGRAVCVSRVPCSNGRTYSVSQNRAVQLEASPRDIFSMDFENPDSTVCLKASEEFSLTPDGSLLDSEPLECVNPALVVRDFSCIEGQSLCHPEPCSLPRVGSVKDRICELECAAFSSSASTVWRPVQDRPDRTGLVLNLASQFDTAVVTGNSVPATPDRDQITFTASTSTSSTPNAEEAEPPAAVQVKAQASKHQAFLVHFPSDEKSNGEPPVSKTNQGDLFSARLDRVFAREERRQSPGATRDAPLRQHSWGAAESKATRESHETVLLCAKSIQNLENFGSPVALVELPAALYLPERSDETFNPEDVPPVPGKVRMHREVLESLQHKVSQPRRSLPDDSTTNRIDPQQLFCRAVSDSAPAVNGSVVSRLKRELEAKATLPLTGSFAPTALTVSMAEIPQQQQKTARQKGSLTTLRKRSMSVDKMNYRSSSKTSSCSTSPSPPPSVRLQSSSVSSSSTSSASYSNSPPSSSVEDSETNVKLMVERIESNRFPTVASTAVPAPSSSPQPSGPSPPSFPQREASEPVNIPQQRTTGRPNFPAVVAKPPVPVEQPVVALRKNRKHHGSTHPLEKLPSRQRHSHSVIGTL